MQDMNERVFCPVRLFLSKFDNECVSDEAIAEVRRSFEMEKRRVVTDLQQKHESEKHQLIRDIKSKQWVRKRCTRAASECNPPPPTG